MFYFRDQTTLVLIDCHTDSGTITALGGALGRLCYFLSSLPSLMWPIFDKKHFLCPIAAAVLLPKYCLPSIVFTKVILFGKYHRLFEKKRCKLVDTPKNDM